MAKDISGTLRKVTLNGITFDAAADVDVTEIDGAFDSESMASSGRNMRKMTKRTQNREGVVLIVNGDEFELLRGLSERTTDFPMSYETAAGDVYRAPGWIQLENRTTAENKATIQMHPRNGNWEPFIAI
jgi:hypothetical protein